MARQNISIGTAANDGTGDTLRSGGTKINANFGELYSALGDGNTLDVPGVVRQALAGLPDPATVTALAADDRLAVILADGSPAQITRANAIAALGGGGGGPALGLWDFFLAQNFLNQVSNGQDSWQIELFNTGANNTTPESLLTYNVGGRVIRLAPGEFSGGRASMQGAPFRLGQGLGFRTRGFITPLLFTTVNARWGWQDQFGGIADLPVDGVYFSMSATGALTGVCRSNSAQSLTTNTHQLTLNRPTVLDIRVAADGSAARFRVYEQQIETPVFDQTVTANIPTAVGRNTSHGLWVMRTPAGTVNEDAMVIHRQVLGTFNAWERAMGFAA